MVLGEVEGLRGTLNNEQGYLNVEKAIFKLQRPIIVIYPVVRNPDSLKRFITRDTDKFSNIKASLWMAFKYNQYNQHCRIHFNFA